MALLLKSIKIPKNSNSGVPGVSDFLISESFPSLDPRSSLNSPTTGLVCTDEKNKKIVENMNRNGNGSENKNNFSPNSTISTRKNTMTMSTVSTNEYDLLYSPQNNNKNKNRNENENKNRNENENENENENKYIDSCTLDSTRSTVLQSFEESLRKEMEAENMRQWRSDYFQKKHIDIKNKGNHKCKQI